MQRFAYPALFLGLFCIGFSGIIIEYIDAPGTVSVFYRVVISTVVFLPVFLIRNRSLEIFKNRPAIFWSLLAGMFFGLDMACWSTAIKLSSATIPTLLANTAPIWVALFSILFLKKRLSNIFWAGLSLTFVSVMFIAFENIQTGASLVSILFGIAAGFLYALFFLSAQKGRSEIQTLDFFFLFVLGASVILFFVNIFQGVELIDYPPNTFLLFLLLAVTGQLIAWMSINFAQGYISAEFVAPTLLGQPVVTAVFAGPLLGDQLTIIEILFGLFVLFGIFLVHRSQKM
jgi:drug/metabolite transporter (DMT)-like permease